jgi:hypothetical protein
VCNVCTVAENLNDSIDLHVNGKVWIHAGMCSEKLNNFNGIGYGPEGMESMDLGGLAKCSMIPMG